MDARARSRWFAAALGVAIVLGVGALLAGGGLGGTQVGTHPPTGGSGAVGEASASPSAMPTGGPTGTTAPGLVAEVPVVSFRVPWQSTDALELAEVLQGRSKRFTAVEITEADMPHMALPAADSVDREIVASDPAALIADLVAHPDRVGFLRADDVTPAVRAIGWGGQELFGVDRVRTLADWELTLQVPADEAAPAPAYDPGTAWTLVAGGDVNLDGAVALAVRDHDRGVDFPWAGGTAEITRRWCCSTYGFELATARRAGHDGAIRELLSGADMAIANFENPAPDAFTYHPAGFVFSADPALIEGLANAGIDWVSLANNHIGDAGPDGVVETIGNLDRWGVAHGGAGPNLEAARAPSILHVGDTVLAILAYDTIHPAYAADAATPGSNEMSARRVRADVAAARAAGADVVLVYPHWGTEYSARPTARQRALAHAAIDAGADLVLGSHTHWVGAMEVYRGRPIVYSLADFVFNIDRAEQTREGVLVEATFAGERLVQLRVDPFFIVGGVQPNLLDPAGDGRSVIDQLLDASGNLLPW